MSMTPPEVFHLTISSLPVELAIGAVLLHQIDAIGTIFLIVPRMVISPVPVVVPSVVIVSLESHGNEQTDT
jgi:hypothetical protein